MTLSAKTDTFEIALTETRLGELESAVRSGLASFVAVGQALIAIQEGRGYRLRGYKTFEDYCEREFGFTDRHGRRMIAAAQTAERVQAVLGEAPANESVARVLTPFADDPITLKKVQARLDKKKRSLATAPAELVAEVVAAVTGKPRPEKVLPRDNGARVPSKPEPAVFETQEAPALNLARLQIILKDVRNWIQHHPALSADLKKELWLGMLDEALVMVYAAHKPASSANAQTSAKCLNCKATIIPGDVFCPNCGGAL